MPTVNDLISRISGILDLADREHRDIDDYEEGEICAYFDIAEYLNKDRTAARGIAE